MTDMDKLEQFAEEGAMTGLPWPKTWNGAYWFVMASFIFWLALLIELTEYGS